MKERKGGCWEGGKTNLMGRTPEEERTDLFFKRDSIIKLQKEKVRTIKNHKNHNNHKHHNNHNNNNNTTIIITQKTYLVLTSFLATRALKTAKISDLLIIMAYLRLRAVITILKGERRGEREREKERKDERGIRKRQVEGKEREKRARRRELEREGKKRK